VWSDPGHDADGAAWGAGKPRIRALRERVLRPPGGPVDPTSRDTAAEQPVRVRQNLPHRHCWSRPGGWRGAKAAGFTPASPLEIRRVTQVPMLRTRSSAPLERTVRTATGSQGAASTRVAVLAARMSNSSPCSAKLHPVRGIRPQRLHEHPPPSGQRVGSVTPSSSSRRCRWVASSARPIRHGRLRSVGGGHMVEESPTPGSGAVSNVTRDGRQPNVVQPTAEVDVTLAERQSSIEAADARGPRHAECGRTGTGASGGREGERHAHHR